MINIVKSNKDYELINDISFDLTAILDILFILLVFFMLTSGTVTQSLKLVLPENKQQQLPNLKLDNYIVLEINRDEYALDGVKFQELREMSKLLMEKQIDNKPLIVASDKNITSQRLLEALTYMKQNGINSTNILINNKQ